MTTKRNNTTHNEVVVERVLTSDAFLTREIKKAPMKTTGDSLIADLTHLPNDLKITIQGAREHNLKNVDLEFPRNRMVVFTGLSGSGKSSLAFDTLFAEGQRRYVESLSAYARQFLGQMDKPDVDFIEGLSPAVSIDQKTTNRNPRSTVGTITEIYDYLRLLFARTGIPHCPECGALVSAQTPQQMVDTLLKYPERTRFQILAPVVRGRKGEFEDLLELLRGDGYARALIDGEMRQLSDDIKLAKQKKHTIEVVVDRLVVKDGIRQRLTDSIETALKLSKGVAVADFVDLDEKDPDRRKTHKTKQLRVVGARENNLKNLNVNFPLGVFTCVTGVSGSGKSTLVNQILYPVLADKLNGARIVPGKHTRVEGVDQCDKVIHVDQNPIGRTPRSNPATYTGVWDKIRTLFAKTPEAQVRGYGPGRFSFNVKGGRCEACHGDGTLKIEMNFLPDVYVDCEECHGQRYNRETLEVKYNGKSVADVLNMPIEEAAQFFKAYPSISRYLDTLVQVGLGYIRLGQPAPTLSGGESQRVKLATELQRRSTGKTVYILDEPTTGLHFEDVRKLLLVLQGLVDKGNAVIVIEHNLDVVKSADWIIDLGPEGGDGGGTIVTEGTPEQVAQCEQSWTGKFLRDML